MKLEQIESLLLESAKLTNHRNFVVVGSLSVMGVLQHPPSDMVMSVDVDFYLKFDPERHQEILTELGEFSQFAKDNGYYADPVSPRLLSLPADWESRLIQISWPTGIVGWFLDPNDAACAKLIRGAQNDMRWVAAGLRAGVLKNAIIAQRLPSTNPCLDGEVQQAMEKLVTCQSKF